MMLEVDEQEWKEGVNHCGVFRQEITFFESTFVKIFLGSVFGDLAIGWRYWWTTSYPSGELTCCQLLNIQTQLHYDANSHNISF